MLALKDLGITVEDLDESEMGVYLKAKELFAELGNYKDATEKSIKDLGDKIDGAEKQKVEDAIAALKQAIQSDNTDDIKAKTEALKQASYKIAEELYKQQGAQGAQPGEGAGTGPDMGNDAGASSNSSSGFVRCLF